MCFVTIVYLCLPVRYIIIVFSDVFYIPHSWPDAGNFDVDTLFPLYISFFPLLVSFTQILLPLVGCIHVSFLAGLDQFVQTCYVNHD